MVPHELTAYLSLADLFFYLMNYGHITKGCKPDNFESHYSLKLSFTNIQDLCSNFVECESFLLCMRLTWLTQLILASSL